jgi:hypothetical protein
VPTTIDIAAQGPSSRTRSSGLFCVLAFAFNWSPS